MAMNVTECDIPSLSVLNRDAIGGVQFHDCYQAPLARLELGVVDLFFAVFGHKPLWIKLLLVARNVVAKRCGLETPTVAEIMRPEIRQGSGVQGSGVQGSGVQGSGVQGSGVQGSGVQGYRVGDKIGPWPIFSIDANELVAGRDNRHMDFRLSVLKQIDGNHGSVFVSTICKVHNIYGKIYLWLVVPFHRGGMRLLMSNAIAAKRL